MVRSEPDGVFSKRLGALEPLVDAVQFLIRRRGTGSKEREHVLHPINNRQRDVHAIDLRNIAPGPRRCRAVARPRQR
jgi:hypothetical protein